MQTANKMKKQENGTDSLKFRHDLKDGLDFGLEFRPKTNLKLKLALRISCYSTVRLYWSSTSTMRESQHDSGIKCNG